MSKVSNALGMLFFLNRRKTYTKISELANFLEVSSREIRRYREDLEMAGFYIENKTGRYGGYLLVSDMVLTLNINHIKQVLNYYNKEKSKLTEVSQEVMLDIITYLKTDQFISNNLLTQEMIEILIKINLAIKLKYKLKLEYLSSNQYTVTQLVEPYLLKNIRDKQYLFALHEDKLKSYRASSIKTIIITEEPYSLNEQIYQKEKNEKAYGVYRSETKYTIIFEVYGKMNDFVDNLFNGEFICLETQTNFSKYQLETYSLHECLYTFLTLGSSLVIISPEEFKDVYKKEINKIKKNL